MSEIDSLEKKILHVIKPEDNWNRNKINVEARADAHAEVVKALNSESHLVEYLIIFYQQTDLVSKTRWI